MKSAERHARGRTGIELIEEATHLLRTAPATVLAAYYCGSLPFVLGLLYFWADMSQNADATEHLMPASLALAGLFVWMKCWQAVFAQLARAWVSAEGAGAWDWRRVGRIMAVQTVLQPSGLLLLPLALLPVLPFPWLYAFYQNLTVLDEGKSLRPWALSQSANRQAMRWPRQNIMALLLLLLFGLFVLLNWAAVLFTLPGLVKMLSGVESAFTRSAESLWNSTTLAAIFALTYLSVDPIVKAMYVLRCFYGESINSGADLTAELKQLVRQAQGAAVALLLAGLLLTANSLGAATAPVPEMANPPASTLAGDIPPNELDQDMDKVIHESKYTWRMPREKQAELDSDKEGLLAGFFQKCADLIVRWTTELLHWLEKQLGDWSPFSSQKEKTDSGFGWITTSEVLLFVLIALVVCALALFFVRLWKARRPRPAAVTSQPSLVVPDLTDEGVSADQLPEDAWSRMGREFLARGELRLAMRAFYLSSLAFLAGRQLVRLAKYKSNREYERELRRRQHALAELPSLFGENVSAFDQIWYGAHQASVEAVERFAANVEKIKSFA